MTTPSLVIIGDVIASRELKDRAGFQRRLHQSLERRNRERGPQGLISPYTLTLGDEFQVVPRRANGSFLDLLRISADLQPTQLRFALALGDIDTAINRDQAIGMDGSAFHRARDGIERLRKERGRCRVEGLDPVDDALVNNGLALAFGRLGGTGGSRLPLTAGLLAGMPMAEISRCLGKSEQTLYKTARTADLNALTEFLTATETLLDRRLKAREVVNP